MRCALVDVAVVVVVCCLLSEYTTKQDQCYLSLVFYAVLFCMVVKYIFERLMSDFLFQLHINDQCFEDAEEMDQEHDKNNSHQ